jgi:hypothetical protein
MRGPPTLLYFANDLDECYLSSRIQLTATIRGVTIQQHSIRLSGPVYFFPLVSCLAPDNPRNSNFLQNLRRLVMTKRHFVSGVVCAVGFSPFFVLLQAATPRNSDSHVKAAAFARLPLSFEANRGQTDAHVKFLSHGKGYTLFLTGDEAVLRLAGRARSSHIASSGTAGRSLPSVNLSREAPSHRSSTNVPAEVLRMRLLHANTSATVAGSDELPGKSNYFIGNDPKNWRTGVETFAQVKYSNVYAGIDIVYYGNQGQLENDFVVAPGADPKKILISLTRQSDPGHSPGDRTRVSQDANGDLIIHTLDSSVTLRKPVAYQMDNSGIRHFVNSGYALRAQGPAEKNWIISFQVPSYDRSKALVIDPTLAYSSYLGGSGLDGGATVEIAVDSSGSAYLAGPTLSTDFPTTPGTVQPSFGGAGAPGCAGTPSDCGDAVLTKINPTGTAIVYSTYLGGSNGDTAYGLAVDFAGNAYLAGSTQSSNFPTTPGAFQSSLNYGLGPIVCAANGNPYGTTGICADMFVAKIDPTGSKLIYSTLIGGSGSEQPQGIVVDEFGNAYVTGATDSADFPTTADASRQPSRAVARCVRMRS